MKRIIKPMEIGGHIYSLSNVQIGIHSDETPDFIADLLLDGKPIGKAENNGHGGMTDFYFDVPKERIEELSGIERGLTAFTRVTYGGKDFKYHGFGEVAEELLFKNFSEKEIWRF